MLDKTTLFLFSPFKGRDVGNPHRGKIKSKDHFKKFLDFNNGINDCFVSLHNLNQKIITKLWFDFDGKENNGTQALDEAKLFYGYLYDRGVSVIPVASGNNKRQGLHIYVLIEPIQINLETIESSITTKDKITEIAYTLIDEVFGHDKDNKLKAVNIDYPLIPDINRIVRVPGTLRPPDNLTYCTYLPPIDFINFNENDLKRHIKQKHYYNYNLFNPLNYNKMNLRKDLLPPHKGESKSETYESKIPLTLTDSAVMLKEIIRPCLFREIVSPNPQDEIRVVVTADLLKFFPPEFIIKIYEGLGWVDFNYNITMKRISYIKNGGLIPYSCSTLRKKGLIRKCDCGTSKKQTDRNDTTKWRLS